MQSRRQARLFARGRVSAGFPRCAKGRSSHFRSATTGEKNLATNKPGGALAPPVGNEFTYYIPKPAAPPAPSVGTAAAGPSIAVTSTKPIPTLTVPAGGGKGAYLNPKDFIQTIMPLFFDQDFPTKLSMGSKWQNI